MAELIGGEERVPVVLTAPDPDWPQRYARHARQICTALGDRVLLMEHIGSTSVPGLVAKPIIDVVLGVADPDREADWLPDLERAGYALRVREPEQDGHRMLRTPARDLHLHVFAPASVEVRRYLLLRDLLRSDPAARDRYAAVKTDLATRTWPTMNHYADAKSEVVEALIALARRRGL